MPEIDERGDRILQELPRWRQTMALDGEKEITVYVDFKSPHAYLAIRPSMELARDYRVRVDFQPYTLSYTGLGISTSIDADMRRRPPDAAADRKARMYYTTARQYAALQRLPFRSPHRLLDSELAHKVFLFARHQKLEVEFMMRVCLEGWGSGWREYHLESYDRLAGTLASIGADTRELEDFVSAGGIGQKELDACHRQAEASGCVGVPHYVLHDAGADRELGLFGREHLALIRAKLDAEGLSRRPDVTADFSHAWRGPDG